MPTNRLDRTLALGVLAVALFSAISAVSMPVPAWRVSTTATVLLTLLLAMHAAVYWFGDQLRARFGLRGYVAAQAVVLFGVTMTGALYPVGLALYIAITAELVIVGGERWGSVPITFGAIVLFGVSAIAAADTYRGATAGLMLAITGVLAHAVAALLRPRIAVAPAGGNGGTMNGGTVNGVVPESTVVSGATSLTPRELEVLRILANGSRTSDIATQLGITERTVKAHLAGIYQKLGVDSRTAAVAIAHQRKLV